MSERIEGNRRIFVVQAKSVFKQHTPLTRATRNKVSKDVSARIAEAKERALQNYRDHWQEFHTKQDAAPEWFAEWCERIPSTCGRCKPMFAAILAQYPPRYHDCFAWTVDVHNAVNAKLGKPLVTVEQARAIWQR